MSGHIVHPHATVAGDPHGNCAHVDSLETLQTLPQTYSAIPKTGKCSFCMNKVYVRIIIWENLLNSHRKMQKTKKIFIVQ